MTPKVDEGEIAGISGMIDICFPGRRVLTFPRGSHATSAKATSPTKEERHAEFQRECWAKPAGLVIDRSRFFASGIIGERGQYLITVQATVARE
jgi:hypothetical protein